MKKNLFALAIFALLLGFCAEKMNAQAAGVKPELVMYRHNGNSSGVVPTPVVNGDKLGTIRWKGLTAIGNNRTGASIESNVTQVSPGYISADLIFRTTTSLTDPLSEPNKRMIIASTGLVGIGTMTPEYHLHVIGNTHTSGRFYGRIHFDKDEPTDLPGTYIDEAYFERKTRAQLGLAANTYTNGGILTLAPGFGSLDRQLFSGGDDGLWTRSQNLANADSWDAWQKLLTSADINGNAGRVARFTGSPVGSASSTLGNSQLFDDGTNVGIGTTVPDVNYLLTVGGRARVNGNTFVNGNLGLGKAPSTTFNLDVAGESNFDGRVKVGASNFPTSTFYKLAVGGGIIAEEVNVQLQTSWADYVFNKDYKLAPLAEVEHFIQTENHLPGVASAKEVSEKGLDLGEMQKAQMEKIEELYLHVINMDKQMQALKSENEALKAKVEQLEKR